MLTLTLDGLPVDLPEDASIALTLWAHDLRTSSSREATFSETFTLPPTAKNAAALRVPHSLDTLSTAPYRKMPALLQAGGVRVLEGVGILGQTSGDGYDITLGASTGDLFALVGSRKLRDLDLSQYDHHLSYADILASQPNDYQHGYTYPLVDDGRITLRDTPAHPILWYELPSFVFYHAILKQIVAECLPGYTLTGSLLNEDRYRRMGFPRSRPWPALRQLTRDKAGLMAATTADQNFTSVVGLHTPSNYAPITFDVITAGGITSTLVSQTYFALPVGLPCDVIVRANLIVSIDSSATPLGLFDGGSDVFFQLMVDGIGQGSMSLYNAVPGEPFPPDPNHQHFVFEHTLTRVGGATIPQISFRLGCYNGTLATVHPGSSVSYSIDERTYVGGPGQLDPILPDLGQADFLKMLANQFQVLFQTDQTLRTLRADLFTDIERNRQPATCVDWSAKIDRTTAPVTTFQLDGYAQANRYAYSAPPQDYDAITTLAPVLAQEGTVLVSDLTLDTKADAYVAPAFAIQQHPAANGLATLGWLPAVAPTDIAYQPYDATLVYVTNDVVVYKGGYWKYVFLTSAGAGYAPTNSYGGGAPVWQELPESQVLGTSNDSLAAVALVTPNPYSVVVSDDSPATTTFTPSQGITSLGISWLTDLLPTYYPTLIALLTNARILSLMMRLNAVDIAMLDHVKPVRLDVSHWPGVGRLSGYFYLNLIDQYLPGVAGPTRVELVKLGDPVAGLAPAAMPLVPRHRHTIFGENGLPLHVEPNATDGVVMITEDGI